MRYLFLSLLFVACAGPSSTTGTPGVDVTSPDGNDPRSDATVGSDSESLPDVTPTEVSNDTSNNNECPDGPDEIGESLVAWRDQLALAARDALLHPTAPSGSGDVYSNTDSSGRLSHWQYDGEGTAADIDEYFSYDSEGRLTGWSHDREGSAADIDEYFSYDSEGRLKHWTHDADSSADDLDAYFSYDSNGRLTSWSYDPDGAPADIDEYFAYDSQGRLTHWTHDADSSLDDVDEYFTYNSNGDITHFNQESDGNDVDRYWTCD